MSKHVVVSLAALNQSATFVTVDGTVVVNERWITSALHRGNVRMFNVVRDFNLLKFFPAIYNQLL